MAQVREGSCLRHYTDKLPGKTTFVNTLCEQNVIEHKDADNAQTANVELGLQIQPVNLEVESEGLRIGLTIVDTPGFGDSIDNEYMFNELSLIHISEPTRPY